MKQSQMSSLTGQARSWPKPLVRRTGAVVVALTALSIAASSIASMVTASIVSPHPPSAALSSVINSMRSAVAEDLSAPRANNYVSLRLAELQPFLTIKSVTVFDNSQRVIGRLTRSPTQQYPTIRTDIFPIIHRGVRLGLMVVNYQPLRRADDPLVRLLLILGIGSMTYGFCLLQITALLTSLSASLRAMRERISDAVVGRKDSASITTDDLTGLHSPFDRLLAVHQLQVEELDKELRLAARQRGDAELRIIIANEELQVQTQIINSAVTRLGAASSSESRAVLSAEIQRACQTLLAAGAAAQEAAAEEGEPLTLSELVTSVVDLWRHEIQLECEVQLDLQETPPLPKAIAYGKVRVVIRSLLRLLCDVLHPRSATITTWHNPDAITIDYPQGAFFLRLDFAPPVAEIDLYHANESPSADVGVEQARRIVERLGGAMIVVAEAGRASALVLTLPDLAHERQLAPFIAP